jgi:hypothetical protein
MKVPKRGLTKWTLLRKPGIAARQAMISLVMPRDFVIPLAGNECDNLFRVITALFPGIYKPFSLKKPGAVQVVLYSRADLHM